MKLNTKNKKPLKQIVLRVLVSWLWDSNPRPADYKTSGFAIFYAFSTNFKPFLNSVPKMVPIFVRLLISLPILRISANE